MQHTNASTMHPTHLFTISKYIVHNLTNNMYVINEIYDMLDYTEKG